MFELICIMPFVPVVLLIFVGAIVREPWVLYLFLALLVLQNFVGILVSNFDNSAFAQVVLLLKELLVYLTVFFALICVVAKKIKPSKAFVIMFVFILIVVAYLFVGQSTMMSRIACLRAIATPLIIFCFGCAIAVRKNEFEAFLRVITYTGALIAAFGFIEVYVFSSDFWINIGLPHFNEIKGFGDWANSDGIPYSFVTYDLYGIVGSTMRRMASIIAEPIAFGHIMALCFCITLFGRDLFQGKDLLRSSLVLIFFISACLSFSKGAILIVAIALVARYLNWSNHLLGLSFCLILVGIVILVAGNMTTSMVNHLSGLLGAFEQHLLIGDGIGTGGNYSSLYGEGDTESAGTESFMGSLIVQAGLPTAVLFFAVFFFVFQEIIMKYDLKNILLGSKRNQCYILGILCFVGGCLVESLVSESSLAFIGSGLGFALVGLVYINSLESVSSNCIKGDLL